MEEVKYFEYGEKEINYLKKKDKKLGQFIDEVGIIKRPLTGDLYHSLVRSIVAQQISSKAAVTVTERLVTLVGGNFTPENILALTEEDIQKCGMSARKASYIMGTATAVRDKLLNLDEIPNLSDKEVISQLSALNGIGEWTAEMLMLFSLGRQDIFSFGDLAIRGGVMRLYSHKKMDRQRFERYRKRFSPYGSVASLYFWHIANNELF